jgi:hypothetical protein
MKTWDDTRADIATHVDPEGLLTGDEDAEELDREFRRIWPDQYRTDVTDLQRYLDELRNEGATR